jgi:hypothetical protein
MGSCLMIGSAIERRQPLAPTMSRDTEPLADILAEGERIAAAATQRGVPVRLLGGVAICMHGVHSALARGYRDIDLATTRGGGRGALQLLEDLGYTPNERFNALNGATRLVVYDEPNGRQVDVFVGEFKMCHAVPIAARLELDPRTVPLAELLLTKLQIVRLNAKDISDIHALVLGHDIGERDDGEINGGVIAGLLARDWGLWRTTRGSLETARAALSGTALSADERAVVAERLDRLWARVEAEPKSMRWRTRARVGDRVRWYEEPEEIAHRTREEQA